jgi:hypothetical protein
MQRLTLTFAALLVWAPVGGARRRNLSDRGQRFHRELGESEDRKGDG